MYIKLPQILHFIASHSFAAVVLVAEFAFFYIIEVILIEYIYNFDITLYKHSD